MPLLHWPDFLLGLSECPHFLRMCSTVLLWRVWYLQTHQGSEHNMLFLMNSPKIFHPDIHDFIQRSVGSVYLYHVICKIAIPKVDKTATLIRQYTQFRFLFTFSGQLWEWRILAACINGTWDLIGCISQLQFIVIFVEIYWSFFMKFLNNTPILSVGKHKNMFVKYNT